MTLLLYAVSSAELTITQHNKLKELGLAPCCQASLSGWVTSCTRAAVEATDRNHLLAYSQLLEAARQVTDLIPVRYGSVFDHAHALQQTLQDYHAQFVSQLEKISGCVEMSVRVPIKRSAPATSSAISSVVAQTTTSMSGRQYLAAKQRQLTQRHKILQLIMASVTGCYVNTCTDYLPTSALLRIHFLVRQSQLKSFKTGITRLDVPQLFLSGPWAAYHFVSLEQISVGKNIKRNFT